eukprot:Skav202680  [mRNA]  locus=scaffold1791:647385:680064:+ [translate_table: standard]
MSISSPPSAIQMGAPSCGFPGSCYIVTLPGAKVLWSSTFQHLKGLSDVGLKQLCAGTCQTMLEGHSGEAEKGPISLLMHLRQIKLDQVGTETSSVGSSAEMQALQNACLEKLLQELQDSTRGHYQGALSAPQQVVLVRSFLTLPRGSGERQARLGVELLKLLDESEDQERWGQGRADQLDQRKGVRDRFAQAVHQGVGKGGPSTKGLQMLEAFAAREDAEDAFWRCFGGRLQIWEATFREAEGQKLAECHWAAAGTCLPLRSRSQDQEPRAQGILQLWRDSPSFWRLLQPRLSELMDPLRLRNMALAMRLRVKLGSSLAREPKESLRAPAALLRSLLPSAQEMSGEALSSLVTALRTSVGGGCGRGPVDAANHISRCANAGDGAVVFVLEQLILLAQEPVTFAPGDRGAMGSSRAAATSASQFFDSNRKVCGDWFQHMRQLLLQTLHRYGSASACYALTQARLVDALNAAATGDRPQPLLEQALQTLQRKKQEGNYRREPVLSTSSSVSSPPSGWPAAVLGLSPASIPPAVTILTDPLGDNALPSQKAGLMHSDGGFGGWTSKEALEALDQNLVPLLSSALSLRDVALCRGAMAVFGQGTWAAGAAPGSCTDALLSFAAQRYEEANLMFAQCSAERPENGTGEESQPRRLGSSRAMEMLVARTWLDSAICARDEEALETWLSTYNGTATVSEALVSFAKSYDAWTAMMGVGKEGLLKHDFQSARRTLREARAAASTDWAEAGATAESIGRLSRWDDLHELFTVEAAVEVKLQSQKAPDALAQAWVGPVTTLGRDMPKSSQQARSSLNAELSALCHTEPLLLTGSLQVPKPQTMPSSSAIRREDKMPTVRLGNIRSPSLAFKTCLWPIDPEFKQNWPTEESPAKGPPTTGALRRAASFDLLHSLQERGYKLAEWILATQLKHRDLKAAGHAARRHAEPLASQAADGAEGSSGRGPSGGGLFSLEWQERWRQALGQLQPTISGITGAQLSPIFMGQCPGDVLGAGWEGWVRKGVDEVAGTDAWSVDPCYMELLVTEVTAALPGTPPATDLQQLTRRLLQGIRRWVKNEDNQGQMSLQWLVKHSKARLLHGLDGHPTAWQELPEPLQQQLVERVANLAETFGPWQRSACGETIQAAWQLHTVDMARPSFSLGKNVWGPTWQAYVRQLNHSAFHASHPQVQRGLLRCLRLTERMRVDSDAMERLERLICSGARGLGPGGCELSAGMGWLEVGMRLETRFLEPLLPQILAYMNGPSRSERDVASVATGGELRLLNPSSHQVQGISQRFEELEMKHDPKAWETHWKEPIRRLRHLHLSGYRAPPGLFERVAEAAPHLTLFPALAAEPQKAEPLELLTERVAEAAPHLTLFPALAAEPQKAEPLKLLTALVMPQGSVHELLLVAKLGVMLQALNVVQRLHPTLLASARRFAVALNAMAIPVDEVCARILQFAETFLTPKSPEEAFGRHGLGPKPCLVGYLSAGAHGLCAFPAIHLRSTLPAELLAAPAEALEMVYLHKQYMSKPPNSGLVELQRRSVWKTCRFQEDQEIILPIEVAVGEGQLMRLKRASQKVQFLSTKTKPKKLDFAARPTLPRIGDAADANSVVEASACKALDVLGPNGAAKFRCRVYDVASSEKAGDDVAEKPKARFEFRDREQVAAVFHASGPFRVGLGVSGSVAYESAGPSEAPLGAVQGLAKAWPRLLDESWVLDDLTRGSRTFEEMQTDSPIDLISRELLLSSLHPGEHFLRQRAYTLSTSFSSVLGYLIGLGDRHLDNLLLDLTTGEAPVMGWMELGLALMAEWRELIVSLAEPWHAGERDAPRAVPTLRQAKFDGASRADEGCEAPGLPPWGRQGVPSKDDQSSTGCGSVVRDGPWLVGMAGSVKDDPSAMVGIPRSGQSWVPQAAVAWQAELLQMICELQQRYRFREKVAGYEGIIDVLQRFEPGSVPRATAFFEEFLKNGINGDGHVRPQLQADCIHKSEYCDVEAD